MKVEKSEGYVNISMSYAEYDRLFNTLFLARSDFAFAMRTTPNTNFDASIKALDVVLGELAG